MQARELYRNLRPSTVPHTVQCLVTLMIIHGREADAGDQIRFRTQERLKVDVTDSM